LGHGTLPQRIGILLGSHLFNSRINCTYFARRAFWLLLRAQPITAIAALLSRKSED
jgi:hypothetical protein